LTIIEEKHCPWRKLQEGILDIYNKTPVRHSMHDEEIAYEMSMRRQ
jgi:hypothetical protein